jgi:hypothetical protein
VKAGSVALLALALAPGCSEPTERTPATCQGCGVVTGGGIGLPPGSGGGAGTSGQAGMAGATAGVTLTGNVLLLDDFSLQSGSLLIEDPVTVRAQAKGGGSMEGTWNGIAPYEIENVLSDPLVWVSLTPVNLVTRALPTLSPVDTSNPAANGRVTVDLAVIDRTLVDTILDILTVPVLRDESKAILILEVTRGDGTPLPGVTVTAPTAETIVYGAAGTFTDDAEETDNSGLVLLVNVPASAWPGTLVGVTFTGALQGGADVRAISGAVTFEGIK